MRVTAAVRRPGPGSGSVRITVARDERIHDVGSVDRYTLVPYTLMRTADAGRPVTIYQRCPDILGRADVAVRFGWVRATAQEYHGYHALHAIIHMNNNLQFIVLVCVCNLLNNKLR